MDFAILVITGALMGILSGMLGVGGGVLLVPALMYIMKIEPHKAIGISLAVIIPTALSGTFKHYKNGNVDIKMALLISIGAVCGAYLGASLAKNMDASTLRKVFGGFLVLMGLNLLFNWTSRVAR